MFQAHDMINFTTEEGVIFVDQAVFAESIGTCYVPEYLTQRVLD